MLFLCEAGRCEGDDCTMRKDAVAELNGTRMCSSEGCAHQHSCACRGSCQNQKWRTWENSPRQPRVVDVTTCTQTWKPSSIRAECTAGHFFQVAFGRALAPRWHLRAPLCSRSKCALENDPPRTRRRVVKRLVKTTSFLCETTTVTPQVHSSHVAPAAWSV